MSLLLREILERIEYERLIEEGRDPSELLHYKFQYIPSQIIDDVISIDPTKKKSYSQWLLSKWDEESDVIRNNLRNGRIERLFQHYKNHSDIQIKDCPSVEDGLREFVPEQDTVLVKSSNPTTILMNNGWVEEVPSELANDFDIVFSEDDWVIAVPNTYEASCKLGENMYWCTAGGRSSYERGRSYYDHYLDESGGKYYINFDMTQGESRLGKDYPFTRYQFHFESNQFMDKNDDPIELGDLDMPQSAKEFYSDEGYDTDNFLNLEARVERYEEQRWGVSYQINDDLYLGIVYDEDYEFTEPNADTDYYLFSNDDDRDPICWDEIPNPHFNENVILAKNNNYCVFRKKYGGNENSVIIASISYGERWEALSFDNYIILPNNCGFFGLGDNGHYVYISSDNGSFADDEVTKKSEKIFVNEYCSNADENNRLFVECISDGFHNLFALYDDGFDVIVKKDMPKNGQYFTINEKGLIEGEYNYYRAYDSDYYEEEYDGLEWDFEDKLPTNDYLISISNYSDYGQLEKSYNILRKGSKTPLIDVWFDEYLSNSKNVYGVEKSGKTGFFSISSGKQIGEWYYRFNGIDKERDILSGINDDIPKTDIIDGYKASVIASFGSIISKKAINNKIVVLDNDGVDKVFDYVDGKFYYPQLHSFMRVAEYRHPYLFYCRVANNEGKAIFDLESEKILTDNLSDISRLDQNLDFIKLTKLNGRVNVLVSNNKSEMFPNDVENVTSIDEYLGIVVYLENGKYYPFNYKTNQVLINPNGIPLKTSINAADEIYCQGDNYRVYFNFDEGTNSFKFNRWQNVNVYGDYGTNFDQQNTPQEVLTMYNLIFGQQESITRKFKGFVNRINEVMKFRYNEWQ